MKYYIWTIGCQMNVADSRRLASALERMGLAAADRVEQADIVVLNTCVVRQSAENKAHGRLSSLRPLKAARPPVIVAVMGCLVGTKEDDHLRRRYPWVDAFLPPSEPQVLLDLLVERGLVDEGRAIDAACVAPHYGLSDDALLLPSCDRGQLVSAYVPAVLGCSHGCAYCIIPYRRGPERSRRPDEIVSEVCALTAQGIREVTLLGQIVDRYGYDLLPRADEQRARRLPVDDGVRASVPLVGLVERVHQIDGLARIRFLTSHPTWLADELLDAVARLPKLCEHIEVPVQAGDDEVLARMRRGYTVDDYRGLVGRIRERVPGVSIATDVIVGFPGETEAQFQHTFDLLSELRLDRVHIARYSPRPQTLAARRFEDDVPAVEKERRRVALDELQAQIAGNINAQFLDQVVKVLVEGRKKSRWWGRTRTDKLVFFDEGTGAAGHSGRADRNPQEGEAGEGGINWLGRLAHVRITWAGPWSLVGCVSGARGQPAPT
jgi:tRNA-2-methylthio-N6-dimethylallyladenosine synthase